MPLDYYARKARLPFGAAQRVAEATPCAKSKVSAVLAGKVRDRGIEAALANLMRDPITGARVTVHEAFGPPARKFHRKGAAMVGAAS